MAVDILRQHRRRGTRYARARAIAHTPNPERERTDRSKARVESDSKPGFLPARRSPVAFELSPALRRGCVNECACLALLASSIRVTRRPPVDDLETASASAPASIPSFVINALPAIDELWPRCRRFRDWRLRRSLFYSAPSACVQVGQPSATPRIARAHRPFVTTVSQGDLS